MSEIGSAVVTGATGFIGSALCRRLGADGARVVCPVRAQSARASKLEDVPGVRVVTLPAFDADTLRRALDRLRCDAVFHLAAYGVDPTERDPITMVEGNVALAANVLVAAKDWAPRRFVFAGSCSEYAPSPDGVRLNEDHPLWPATLYGAAKAAAHVYAATLAAHVGVDFVGLRIFGTYGVGEARYRLVRYLIDRLRAGDEPELTPGDHQRDLSYVEDVVDALVLAATHPGVETGRVYNVCSGIPRRIRDVAARVAEVMGRPDAPLGLGRRPYRADEPRWLVGDPSRFAAASGWAPRVSLDEGIRRMIEGTSASC